MLSSCLNKLSTFFLHYFFLLVLKLHKCFLQFWRKHVNLITVHYELLAKLFFIQDVMTFYLWVPSSAWRVKNIQRIIWHHRDTVMWKCFLHHLIPCDVLPWNYVTRTLSERIIFKLDGHEITVTSSFILKYHFDWINRL